MDQVVGDTGITIKRLQELLASSSRIEIDGISLKDAQAEPLGDQGYTSRIYRVTLTWSGPSKSLPDSIIVKMNGSDATQKLFKDQTPEEIEELKREISISHNVECAVYELGDLYEWVPMPICYASIRSDEHELGLMLLEDLKDCAVLLPKVVMFTEGLNEARLEQALQILTSLHAWSVNTDADWKRSIPKLSKNAVICTTCEFRRGELPQSKAEYPEALGNLDEDKAYALVNKTKYVELFGGDPVAKYDLPVVLVHGDIQLLNVLFAPDSEGNATDSIVSLIDWQMAHQGCGLEDVARLFGWCISTETRKSIGDKLIERYVEVSPLIP